MLDHYPSPFSIGGSSARFAEALGFASLRIFLGLVTTIRGATSTLKEDRDKVDPYSIYSCSVHCRREPSTTGPELCYIEPTPED